jgi:hypothetical protein
MRLIALTAVSALALGAAACAPHIDYAHKTSLDCPDRQGELTRTGVAADRKSCTYRASEGAEVTLQLTPVANGDAGATLSAIEASLVGPATPEPAAKTPAKGAKAPPAPPTPPASPAAGGNDAERAAREAAADAAASKSSGGGSGWGDRDKDGDTVTINGKTVVEDDGHSSHVRLPGLHIDAEGDNAKVDIAGLHIDANDDHQTVKMIRDVRLRGEAFSRERRGLRAFFVAKRQDLPDGYRFVGYQASGPKAGPLTIAVVKSRDEMDHGDRLYRDIQRLVRLNGGA